MGRRKDFAPEGHDTHADFPPYADGRCRECSRLSARKYREANPEKARKAARDYQRRQRQKEKIEALKHGEEETAGKVEKSPQKPKLAAHMRKVKAARKILARRFARPKTPESIMKVVANDEYKGNRDADKYRRAITAVVRVIAHLIADLDHDNGLLLILRTHRAPEHAIEQTELLLEGASLFVNDHLFFNGRRLNENGDLNLALFEALIKLLTDRAKESAKNIEPGDDHEPRKATTSLTFN